MLGRWACVAILLIASRHAAAQSPAWWDPGSDDSVREWGKLQEIQNKRFVFVSVECRSGDTRSFQQDCGTIHNVVLSVLRSYPEFEVVSLAGLAEFAIHTSVSKIEPVNPVDQVANFAANLDPAIEVPMSVSVVVRGMKLSASNYRPRVVWEISSPNVRGNPSSLAAFAVDGFVAQLRKIRKSAK